MKSTLEKQHTPKYAPNRLPSGKGSKSFVSPPVISRFPSNHSVAQHSLACACGGGCPRCKQKAAIQPKLKIGAPDDKYEQEADRVADQIMLIPESGIQRQPT